MHCHVRSLGVSMRRLKIGFALCAALGATAALCGCGSSSSVASTISPERNNEDLAFSACQTAIDTAAQFKILKQPPWVENKGSGDRFRFVWNSGDIVFQNAFGASVNTSAECAGSLSGHYVDFVSVDGVQFLNERVTYPSA